MKYLFFYLVLFFNFKAVATNTLTLNIEGKKETKEIQKIEISEGRILIQANDTFSCVLELEQMISGVPKSSHCEGCKEYTATDRFKEMFFYAENASIGCQINEGKVIGFNFQGNTKYRGEGALVNYGRVFDMKEFGPEFSGVKERNSFEKTMDSVEKVLLKILF